jgi:hypothetical protein
MSDEERRDWERQPHETSRSYALFCAYRNLGPERSLRKLKQGTSGAPNVNRLKRLSTRWNWVERARKYDDYLEYQDRLQQESERREMRKRHAKMGVLGQSVAVKALENLLNKVQSGGEVSAGDASRLLDTGVKVERLARGEPTDSHEVSGPGRGPVKLDLAETLKRIDEVYGLKTEKDGGKKPGPGDGSGTSDP